MTKMQEYMQKGEDYILKTYNRYPVVFEKLEQFQFGELKKTEFTY